LTPKRQYTRTNPSLHMHLLISGYKLACPFA